jgi:hypothetical protein
MWPHSTTSPATHVTSQYSALAASLPVPATYYNHHSSMVQSTKQQATTSKYCKTRVWPMHSGLATSNQPAEYGLQPANCGSCHTCSYWTRRLVWSESALNLPPWDVGPAAAPRHPACKLLGCIPAALVSLLTSVSSCCSRSLLPPAPSSPPRCCACLSPACLPPLLLRLMGGQPSASRVHPTMMSAMGGTYIWMHQHQQRRREYSTLGSALSATVQQLSRASAAQLQLRIGSASAAGHHHASSSCIIVLHHAAAQVTRGHADLRITRDMHTATVQASSPVSRALCSLLLVRCRTAGLLLLASSSPAACQQLMLSKSMPSSIL